jgi:hypothetical protein
MEDLFDTIYWGGVIFIGVAATMYIVGKRRNKEQENSTLSRTQSQMEAESQGIWGCFQKIISDLMKKIKQYFYKTAIILAVFYLIGAYSKMTYKHYLNEIKQSITDTTTELTENIFNSTSHLLDNMKDNIRDYSNVVDLFNGNEKEPNSTFLNPNNSQRSNSKTN